MKKNKFFKLPKNFASNLKLFDIVCGPLGTTTFETILAGSFPVIFKTKYKIRPIHIMVKKWTLDQLRNEIYNKKIVPVLGISHLKILLS